jgi:mRNA-degrading endonuclease RelE of RelBE toxin-antitoxin system
LPDRRASRITFTRRADKDYQGLSQQLRRQADKQFDLLMDNLRHPSIDAKKYGGTNDIWQGRVNRDYRFYFRIDGDTYIILTIIPHPK